MKQKTLDKANTRISELETELAKANEAKANNHAKPNFLLPNGAQTHADSCPIPTVAKSPVRTPEDLGLTLDPVTEDSLMEAIRGETDYRKRWLLQRKLTTVQTARAVEQVKANKRARR